MNSLELLAKLSEEGVKLWAEGDRLRIRAPKGVLTSKRQAQLAECKEEILRLLHERDRNTKIANLPLVAVSREEPLPLSFEQERLWLVNQFLPKTATLNLVQGIRLRGHLNKTALEKSLNQLGQRHEALRTTFPLVEGKPIQKINFFSVTLSVEDYQHLPASEQKQKIQQIADGEAHRAFDLSLGPLWRFLLIRLGDSDHVLLVVFHHIVGDILSASILRRELATLYQAICLELPSPLPELPLQYGDFSVWQRQWLQAGNLEAHLGYWQKYLAGAPAVLDLPTNRPRSSASSFQGAHFTFQLPSQLWSSLKQLSRETGITTATILLAAFEVLLHKCSAREDIVIGFPTSGRVHPQLESLIGFFSYPLALRCDLSGNPSFRDLLRRLREGLLESYNHQMIPLSKVVEAVQPQRSREYSTLFQILFGTFLGSQLDSLTIQDLTFTSMPEVNRSPTDLDMFWTIYEIDGQLNGVIGYNEQLFAPDTIEEFVQSYRHILTQGLHSAETKLSEFSLAEKLDSKVEAARLREQKSTLAIAATFTAEPMADSLNYWLEELQLPYQIEFAPYNQVFQQLLAPDSLLAKNSTGINIILVRFEDWLRYDGAGANLSAIASKSEVFEQIERNGRDLVAALREASARSSIPHLVCLCPPAPTSIAEKEAEDFWRARETLLAKELAEMAGVYLITSTELMAAYPVRNYYDSKGDELGHIPFTPMLYTSLATLLARKISALKRSPYKVMVVDCDNTLWRGVCGEDGVSGIVIDDSYRALQEFMVRQHEKGMLLCLCSKNNEEDVRQVFEQRADMVLKWEHLVSCQINWQPKSSNLKSLAQELQLGLNSFILLDDNPVECAEVIEHCPEVLTLQLPEKAEDIPPFLEHIWACDRLKVTAEDRQRTSFYHQNVQRQQVLRESFTLGDFIKSLNLKVEMDPIAPSLWERASQLTQRTNQFNATTIRRSESEIQILCQSGDHTCLVVKVKDRFGDYGLVGLVIFTQGDEVLKVDTFLLSCRTLGRGVEHQMLAQLGKIARERNLHWVEVNYEQTPKNQPMLTFLESVGNEFKEPREKGFRFCFPADYASKVSYSLDSQSLPEVGDRVPQASQAVGLEGGLFQRIATQLATPEDIFEAVQGYLKMRSPAWRQERTSSAFVPPKTETEKLLAEVWADLLHLEQVGIHDNFFALGGDSILMIQAVARASQVGLNFTPMQIFEHQTIAKLASVVEQTAPLEAEQGLVTGTVPLTPIQQWFFEQDSPEAHHFNQSVLLEVEPVLKSEVWAQAVQQLLLHHDALRLRYSKMEAGWQQVNSDQFKNRSSFQVVDLSELSPEEQKTVLKSKATEIQKSLNLGEGPIVRVVLFQLGNGQADRLLLVIHHLAVDGVSWRILLEDLVSACQQLEQGQTVQLPPKTTSFKAWAERLRDYAQSEELAAELDYWLSVSADNPPSLPVDTPPVSQEANTVAAAARISVSLNEAQTRALVQDVPSAYNTQINDVLLTALVQSFSDWTGNSSLLLDLEGHGREDILEKVNLSRTVGWFTSLFPVRLSLSRESLSPGEALKSVKEQLRGIPHRGIGYGVLRYLKQDLTIREKLWTMPQAQVSFNYLGQFEQVLSSPPPLGMATESKGAEYSPLMHRPYLLEIVGYLTSGRLQLDWVYSQNIHHRETIQDLAERFLEALNALIIHCQSREAGGYTPSDFPDADLSQEELDELLESID
jgi:FkbH-like protein/non-ribosomal peptide synthase protein (TIGR01720 family)